MKNKIALLFLSLLALVSTSQNANISGFINDYAIVTNLDCNSLTVASVAGFAPGDKVLLIQMKGALMDSSNTTSFGTLINYAEAGNYELATINSVSGNTIILVDSVLRKYNLSGSVQLVKVPVYNNVTVTSQLSCLPWDGYTGGIVALKATGIATLNADIDVSGMGFRGGALGNGSLGSCSGDTGRYSLPSTSPSSAMKGEGIVNDSPVREDGKGPNVNGGGSGQDCNGGGAGGGNFGAGGHGGDSKCNVSCPAYFYQNSGGYPGKKLGYSNILKKVFMGGGGGAGHENNSSGTSGTNGGGIIIIIADSISGGGHYLRADGINNSLVANNDGQGGGGAGGSILLSVRNCSALNASARGGYGGTDNFTGTDCHGKGGGGGGGVVWTANGFTLVNAQLNGGAPGTFTASASLCNGTSNGATAGQPGGYLVDLVIPQSQAVCSLNSIHALGLSNKIISFFPNPFNGTITLSSLMYLNNAVFTLTDVLGNEIKKIEFSGKKIIIENAGLAPAIYFYRVTKDAQIISAGKIVAE